MSASKPHSVRPQIALASLKSLLEEEPHERVMAVVEDPSLLDFVGDLIEQLEAQQRLLLAADEAFRWVAREWPKVIREMPPNLYRELKDARVPYPAFSPQTHERDCRCDSCREASLPPSEPYEQIRKEREGFHRRLA